MIYDLGFAVFSLFYLPALVFKGKLHKDFGERFGEYSKDKRDSLAAAKDVIWIQAVSVGEVALCRAVIPLIKKRFQGSTIVLSTITKTGNDLAKKLFSNDAVIIYFPLDFGFIVRKVAGLIRPKIYIMVETEIWPNVLKELDKRSVPSIIINGRISDRSFGKYMFAKPFLRKTLGLIRKYCMQSKLDADRIIAMGAPAENVSVAGNIKFDILPSVPRNNVERTLETLELKRGDTLFVAGSTHPGEEEMVISSYDEILKRFPDLKLLIAPRHVERSSAVDRVVRAGGFKPVMVSNISVLGMPLPARTVFILDKIGQLAEFYAASTIVFVGGSLIKHGGQNPIEPAILEKPVMFGPHMFNFRSIVAILLEREGAVQVKDIEELTRQTIELLSDPDKRSSLGRNARAAISDNRGAADRCVEDMATLLKT
ncbi:MAG: 3-deoxy-D-manno-octulosonic acid transferase [Candidatus Omnitrophica bacterium]|nr:3-deoxy-D-manno-octulosonic acid transferase [Candidatus Omnitrophota bacterium]